MTLIRLGVASVLAGGIVAAGAFAAGCGGDDNGGTTPMGDDSGMNPDGTMILPMDDGGPGPGMDGSNPPPKDGGTSDAADAGPAVPPHGKVILVHGTNGAPPLRFCYGAVTTLDGGDAGSISVLPVNPSPNTALGVPPGTGGPGADSTRDLMNQTLEVYAIASAALTSDVPSDGGTELTCDKLIGSKALAADAGGLPLVQGLNYWDIGALPAGTIADNTTTLIVVNGCVPGISDTAFTTLNCPSGYNVSTGDLGMWTAKLDTTTVLDGGSIGAQFAYASNAFSYESAGGGNPPGVATVAGFYTTTLVVPDAGASDAGDAGDAAPTPVPVTIPQVVAAGVTNGQLKPATVTPVSGVTFDGTSGFFVNSVSIDGGSNQFKVAMPLPNIQQISAPSVPLDAGYFANGVNYVFVLVGDPAVATLNDAGMFDPQSVHIVAFPTNPPFGAN
jgi:hypothetical protein